ncbi:MAG: hypothetical protein FJ215_07945 [Ignavibacteria bacterium]|nr:hypothetical protein [Ignavibacteria bacterium]
MHVVKFPLLLTIRNANCIIERCQAAIFSPDQEILFDLSNCAFSDPFAITFIVGAAKACIARGHVVSYRPALNKKLNEYLTSIGFYEWGKGRDGAMKYAHHQAELRHFNGLDPTYTSTIINVLQSVLTMSQGVKDSLHLSINELMTNTFDHSETLEGCFVCAQSYTERGNVNICITDFGRGILRALSSVPTYAHLTNSIDAIKLAIEEGVSSRVGKLAGLGLTHIHRFLKVNEGEIHIMSGDGWVHWNYKNGNGVAIWQKKLRIAFEGTIVNIIARADGEGLYILESEMRDEPIF